MPAEGCRRKFDFFLELLKAREEKDKKRTKKKKSNRMERWKKMENFVVTYTPPVYDTRPW